MSNESEQRTTDLVVALLKAADGVALGRRITDTGYGVDGMLFATAAEEIKLLRAALAEYQPYHPALRVPDDKDGYWDAIDDLYDTSEWPPEKKIQP